MNRDRELRGRRRALRLIGAAPALVLMPGGRAVAAPFSEDAVARLGEDLHALRRRFGLRNAIGIYVEHLESRQTLFEHNADRAFVPASGMKLVVMGAALHYLGPSFRFRTRLLLDAPPDERGVVAGPVYVRGEGDPSFTRHDMDYIADSLAAAGLAEIRGDFVLDDSFFEPQETDQELVRERIRTRTPIQSALAYQWNQVEVAGVPAAGDRPEVRDEGHGYYEIDNRMVMRGGGRPYILAQRRGGRRVRLQGRILRNGNERVARFTATEPSLYFGYALRGKLRDRGIVAAGEVRRGVPPAGGASVLYYEHKSAPLIQVVEALGKYSNNWSAEQVLFAVGAHRWGPPGTLEKGIRTIEEYGVGLGFPADSLQIADGSGLSRQNRLSPRFLTAVVRDLYRPPELRDEFLCSLAMGGVDGTLARRLRGETTLGRVLAKTGSLLGVSSLSGVVFPARGKPHALGFSIVTRGIRNQWNADAVENRMAAALAGWDGAAD